jgi:hypothetical protein
MILVVKILTAILCLPVVVRTVATGSIDETTTATTRYGVDVSFPMHYNAVSDNYDWLPHNMDPSLPVPDKYKDKPVQPLGDRQKFYDEFLDGCVKYFGKQGKRCVTTERDRIDMALRQPQSMQNYTEMGFKKIRAPPELMELILSFWQKNKENQKVEQWGAGNTYVRIV